MAYNLTVAFRRDDEDEAKTPYKRRFDRDWGETIIPFGAMTHARLSTTERRSDVHTFGPDATDALYLLPVLDDDGMLKATKVITVDDMKTAIKAGKAPHIRCCRTALVPHESLIFPFFSRTTDDGWALGDDEEEVVVEEEQGENKKSP